MEKEILNIGGISNEKEDVTITIKNLVMFPTKLENLIKCEKEFGNSMSGLIISEELSSKFKALHEAVLDISELKIIISC